MLIILLIFLLGIGYKTARIVLPAYRLWQDAKMLLAITRTEDFTTIDPDKFDKTTQSAYRNTRDLHGELKLFFPLFRKMGWIPLIGDEINAVPDMLEAGLRLSESGAILSKHIGAPLLQKWQADSSQEMLLLIAQTVDESQSHLPIAQANLLSAEYFLNEIDLNRLNPELRDPLQRLLNRLPDAKLSLETLQQMPNLTGLHKEERRYLLILQNEDELRATGGFISAVGVARFEAGHLETITFQDSYTIDNPAAPLFAPPEPLQTFALTGRWVLRDANWSPDAPTAAHDIQKIYEANTRQKLDGVVMLDQEAVVKLVDALGPLTLPDFPEPVTGVNLREYMRHAYSPNEVISVDEWWLDRKQFIQVLFDAIMKRIQTEYSQVEFMRLWDNLQAALDEGHLILNIFTLPGVQAIIEQQGWQHPLMLPQSGDYLMVVNSNLGFNKVNAVVQSHIDYHVSFSNPETPFTQLTLSYTQPQGEGVECIHEARYGDTLAYEEMISRCYWNFVRIYTPTGIQLVESSLHPIAGESLLSLQNWNGEARRTQEILSDDRLVQPITQLLLIPGGGS
ncbi:MAG: DUF4012 domain-containing protein, partial [Anaerolineae bacterium]|nr:DUF4012 domain-containing protein [Anaerolineae bacterium]